MCGKKKKLQMNLEEMYAALMRHVTPWIDGNTLDSKSGLPHTWKMLATAAIITELERKNSPGVADLRDRIMHGDVEGQGPKRTSLCVPEDVLNGFLQRSKEILEGDFDD